MGLPMDTFDCEVQMCGFPSLDITPEDHSIPKWVRWDGLMPQESHRPNVQPMQPASVSAAQDSMVTDYDSDTTIAYDLESYMGMDYDSNHSDRRSNIRADINDVIREVTPAAWLDNPLPSSQHVVTDNYSPASPVYSPDHSLIEIDSDEEEGLRANLSPAPLDMPIVTPSSEIFDTDNSDLDLDFEGELEVKNILTDYCNTGKLPTRSHGVFVYPKDYHVHGHSWNEYPDEPCSPHCVIPARADKGFAKFYLTNRLCQKHNSTMTGPWIYLSNRISTPHKLYKCPEICHFITLLSQKVKHNHEIRDSLLACQLVENQHVFTLNIRVDVFLVNDPFAIKSWYQSYNLDDMPSFTGRLHYYEQMDFVDKIHEAYLDGQP